MTTTNNKMLDWLTRQTPQPRHRLLAMEWAMMAYALVTTLVFVAGYCTGTRTGASLTEPLIGRLVAIVAVLAVATLYHRLPCRLTLLLRFLLQMGALSWWYPDTYELNKAFANLDPLFASIDQQMFGFQPALVFSAAMPQAWWSELMHLGYASYYPLMLVVALFYFFRNNRDFGRATFVLIGSFFVYYLIFVALPVTGPQYYYQAVGTATIATGHFPDVGNWFATHMESLPIPGWADGFFYHLVETAHAAGERPTAAFPSSHVGVTTILVLQAWYSGSRRLFAFVVPFYALMCLATVYIQAHYAIDVVGGWVSGVALFFVLDGFYRKYLVSSE